jgi:galactose mutarotase-like enzyme
MTERVQDEKRVSLSNDRIRIVASNRGAILRSIHIDGQQITRTLPDKETSPGEKAALVCTPIIFGRIENRKITFQGKEYEMPYPEDLNPDEIDPSKTYIHGIHHYYTYDIEQTHDNKITFILNKNRLPRHYPFPHTTRITYALDGNDLLISVEVFDTNVPTPALLTVHPFFRFTLPDGSIIQAKARLLKKFEYDTNATLPQPKSPPVELEDGGPIKEWTTLDTSLDHSFISENPYSEIRWEGGPHLALIDESELHTPHSHYPLQIWTTGGHTRNACAIEQGGPANMFELVHEKKVPEYFLPVVMPGESKKRVVRYQTKELR